MIDRHIPSQFPPSLPKGLKYISGCLVTQLVLAPDYPCYMSFLTAIYQPWKCAQQCSASDLHFCKNNIHKRLSCIQCIYLISDRKKNNVDTSLILEILGYMEQVIKLIPTWIGHFQWQTLFYQLRFHNKGKCRGNFWFYFCKSNVIQSVHIRNILTRLAWCWLQGVTELPLSHLPESTKDFEQKYQCEQNMYQPYPVFH